jgi:hypothetical protein
MYLVLITSEPRDVVRGYYDMNLQIYVVVKIKYVQKYTSRWRFGILWNAVELEDDVTLAMHIEVMIQ